jgi:hypothetical protein
MASPWTVNHNDAWSHPRDSDLIGLGRGLGFGIFTSTHNFPPIKHLSLIDL